MELMQMPDDLLKMLPKMLESVTDDLRNLTIPYFNTIVYIPDEETVLFCIHAYLTLKDVDKISIHRKTFMFPEIPDFEVQYHEKHHVSTRYQYWFVGFTVFDFLWNKRQYPYLVLCREDFINYFIDVMYEWYKLVDESLTDY